MTLGEGAHQLGVFVVFACIGVVQAAAYVFASGFFKGKWCVLWDLLFGAQFTFCVWIVNVQVNCGKFRAFVFVALAVGAIIAVATCKSTLDRTAKLLYNLATSQKVANNEIILQKGHVNFDSCGNNSANIPVLHVADNANAANQPKTKIRKIASNGGSRQKRRAVQTGTVGIQKNR